MQEDVFVGRERELQKLDACLDKALSGQGQVCFVVGQPGSGKTALVRQFADRARNHFEQVVARYDADRDHDLAHVQAQDPAVGALCYLSFVLSHQGYPEQAAAAVHSALERAEKLDHPYTIGYAASFAAMLYQMLRQWPECGRATEGHDLLSVTCAGFGEGFDTADLREARELLQQLALAR